ncbi:MAG: sulfite exporter TauE/SafE family protein [Planctomycetes bacterium]|nr:sulfite exporter TauE/SafE family protein [Planctomycetota bacterium]
MQQASLAVVTSFLVTVFLTNIVQGITGFAGAVLAMPFCARLVGLPAAKTVLCLLGATAGLQVCLVAWRSVRRDVLRTVCFAMIPAMLVGFVVGDLLRPYEAGQKLLLGAVITGIGVAGLVRRRLYPGGPASSRGVVHLAMLLLAGLVHGMFACGGPFLVAFLADRLPEKTEFRATASTVWVVVNSLVLLDQYRNGALGVELAALAGASIPVAFCSVYLGGLLLTRVSQEAFMTLTYLLLAVSGLSLLLG